MKKIITIVVIVALVLITGVAYASNHLVKTETKYSYDKGLMNQLTGKTTLHIEKIETKLFSGEVIETSSEEAEMELTAEMLAFRNSWTRTQIELR